MRPKLASTVFNYTSLMLRMFHAADRLMPMTAARVGMHWERWAQRQTFGRKPDARILPTLNRKGIAQ